MPRWAETATARTSLGCLALACVLVTIAAACGGSKKSSDVAAAAASAVAVYPLSGTPDASPAAEISFRGIAPAKLHGVSVVGSKSGRHPGTLEPHSDGKGASFVPAKHFTPGETVRVRAGVPLVGAQGGTVSFRIERPPVPGPGRERPFPDGTDAQSKGALSFHSRPDLHPPGVEVTTSSPDASPGYLLMGPKSWPGQSGPLIFDSRGRLVWFHPVPRRYKTYDFRASTYQGKPVLTWWQGRRAEAFGGGVGIVADSSYREIATVTGGNGYPVDIHEFNLTPNGTALVLAYRAVRWDLRPLGSRVNKAAIDGIVMEIDVATGRVLFEWHSLGHIPLTESYRHPRADRPVDYVHLNSVALDRDGNFLVSARNTSTVYKIDRRTGNIIWRLGGKHSTFALPKYARFVGQHDFSRAPDGTYILFDNANVTTPVKWVARGLVFSIDAKGRTATLVRAFSQPQKKGSTTQGSIQPLADGHYVLGWGGGIPQVSEFSSGGTLLFDARLVGRAESYRAYRVEWTGRPVRPPDLAVATADGKPTAYMSWNGATDVAEWRVLTGSSPDRLAVTTRVPWRGFETAVALPPSAGYVAVEALDDGGNALDRSKTVEIPKG
jgi:hypothetical protein